MSCSGGPKEDVDPDDTFHQEEKEGGAVFLMEVVGVRCAGGAMCLQPPAGV